MTERQPFFDRQVAVSLLEEVTQFLRECASTPNRNVKISVNLSAEVNRNLPQNGQSFSAHSIDSNPANRNVPQHGQRFQTQSL